MLTIARWKFWSIILVCLAGFIFALPNALSPSFYSSLPDFMKRTINLGLDLRGGSHLQLEVDLKTVSKEYLSNLLDEARASLRKAGIGYSRLMVDQKGDEAALHITLRNAEEGEKAQSLIKKIDDQLTITLEGDQLIGKLSPEAIAARNKAIIEQSIEVVRRRIDESGTKEPNIQRQGEDRIMVQLPGVDDPAEVKRLIGRTAKMTFRLVDHSAKILEGENAHGTPSADSEYLPEVRGEDNRTVQIPVKKQVMVSGESLIDAQATVNQYGQPAVSLRFNSLGARKFAEMSANNIKKQFAIVLDNKVISAPVFNEPIMDGNGQISGSFTFKEASDLALLLRAGALPAPLKVIEERTVGPSLGSDSIAHGRSATIYAFILVSVFMLLSYALFGFFADLALLMNLILLFAGLSLLQATLTLPGIAGIALTIGMAVDATVLIFERIKEEIRSGVKPVPAINAGYRRAMTTIIDSNLTTLIGAAVLFEFGTGPIKGFAVTLALGILISLFTSLSLTRLIIIVWLGKDKKTNLPI